MPTSKQRLLTHLRTEVYCKLGISPIHGIGVFALRTIPKGVNPLVSWISQDSILFTHQEIKGLPSGVKKQMRTFCYYDKKGYEVPRVGMNSMDMAIYLNHSKSPNLKMQEDGQFVALRAIRTGEELTMDYDDSFGDTHIF